MKTPKSVVALALLFAGAGAFAQRPLDIVKWSAETKKSTPTAADVALTATVEDGWHVYAVSQGTGGPTPLRITVPTGSSFMLKAPVAEGNAIKHFDEKL